MLLNDGDCTSQGGSKDEENIKTPLECQEKPVCLKGALWVTFQAAQQEDRAEIAID